MSSTTQPTQPAGKRAMKCTLPARATYPQGHHRRSIKLLANALSGGWNNSEDNVVNLHKFDPKILHEDFQVYLEIVYTNKFTPIQENQYNTQLCRVYVIAKAMMDRQTRNVLLQAMYDGTQEVDENGRLYYPGSMCVRVIYKGTMSAADPMRRLLVDMIHDASTLTWYGGTAQKVLPNEFLFDLALRGRTRASPTYTPLEYDILEYLEEEPETAEEEEKDNLVVQVAGGPL
ncbi:hypothetical protein EK21DRAFT_109191 [Setomelanomma holmii]|uniref:Uncharacterized protein n=1 Tax=Setomelanomma holmii TaxID=210430 RepID=A0A9P4HF17_9PLEO|nr:hypothetical protein EK21DRAFT_109191 [Setomelanomma holmii]